MSRSSDDCDERRQAFRIEDHIHLHLSSQGEKGDDSGSLNFGGEKMLQDLTILRELGFQSHHLLAGIRKFHPEIAQYLALIDKKINLLTRSLSAVSLGDDIQPNCEVSLSVSGLSFNSQRTYKPQDSLALKMIFFPETVFIECWAHVVYSMREQGGGYQIALEFDELGDDDHELLLRHMIERQSEQIRKQRDKKR